MTACLNTMPEHFCPLWTLGSLREQEWSTSIPSSAIFNEDFYQVQISKLI